MKIRILYLRETDNPVYHIPYRSKVTAITLDNGNRYVMYAHTNNKELLKEFKSVRDMSKFHIVEREMNEETYAQFNKVYPDLKLDNIEYISDTDDCLYLVSNLHEYNCVNSDYLMDLEDEIREVTYHRYDNFKKEYIIALDKLFYCTQSQLLHESDPTRLDALNHLVYGYQCTVEMGLSGFQGNMKYNEISLLFKLFGNTFKKG